MPYVAHDRHLTDFVSHKKKGRNRMKKQPKTKSPGRSEKDRKFFKTYREWYDKFQKLPMQSDGSVILAKDEIPPQPPPDDRPPR